MKWGFFLNLVAEEPVFTSAVLKRRGISTQKVRLQLVRWVEAGRLVQLRRGVYMLAEPYRRREPHPFLLANKLKKASYVSLQSALAYHGLIPESVPVVMSVTTGRPERLSTKAGGFVFKHVKKTMFQGFRAVEVARSQSAFVALPEKALLDLVYLTPKGDTEIYLKELRVENLDRLNRPLLLAMARSSGSPKLIRAARRFLRLTGGEGHETP
ncbi:MAG: type IV toxin-antitoxin system AbiEi family antitoxin domain-containing protein [Candidatus Aminicenantes bacterium]|nr:type IV toxin-antitoxin system AbiEi family antitoxin domain-containing protein [Candidatus Aminicenantes bacterium]